MLSLDEMKKIRKKKNMSYEEIARKSGVSISSVQKIFGSENPNPRKSTLEKLSMAFSISDVYSVLNDNEYKINDKNDIPQKISDVNKRYNIFGKGKVLSGSLESQKSMSGYTWEDYVAMELPEGKRIEIIDGVVYDMTSPSQTHQAILGYLFNYLYNELRKRKRRCLPFMAPFAVRLDFDDGPTTVVQPDLLVKCSQDVKVDDEGNELPWIPRFVIEILSTSTRSKDMYIKTKKYKESGIIEYWLIDNKSKQVIKYNFETDKIEIFGYDRKIPIDIFEGDIKIDMKDLQDYLEEYADIIGA